MWKVWHMSCVYDQFGPFLSQLCLLQFLSQMFGILFSSTILADPSKASIPTTPLLFRVSPDLNLIWGLRLSFLRMVEIVACYHWWRGLTGPKFTVIYGQRNLEVRQRNRTYGEAREVIWMRPKESVRECTWEKVILKKQSFVTKKKKNQQKNISWLFQLLKFPVWFQTNYFLPGPSASP